MDLCALPNNNHPEKFLQLDVGRLPVSQVGALVLAQRHWHNRVYVQVGPLCPRLAGLPAPTSGS